jgi:hypothetical protein
MADLFSAAINCHRVVGCSLELLQHKKPEDHSLPRALNRTRLRMRVLLYSILVYSEILISQEVGCRCPETIPNLP